MLCRTDSCFGIDGRAKPVLDLESMNAVRSVHRTMRAAALLLPASKAIVLESGRADRDRDPIASVSQLARFDCIAPPCMLMPRWRTRRCAHFKS
jgi:hypothetical protein